jgi:hypothetical protein
MVIATLVRTSRGLDNETWGEILTWLCDRATDAGMGEDALDIHLEIDDWAAQTAEQNGVEASELDIYWDDPNETDGDHFRCNQCDSETCEHARRAQAIVGEAWDHWQRRQRRFAFGF